MPEADRDETGAGGGDLRLQARATSEHLNRLLKSGMDGTFPVKACSTGRNPAGSFTAFPPLGHFTPN